MDDAEPRAERPGEEPGPRRRPDQGEFLDRHLYRAGAGALPDHDVQLVVLHRGVEDLFDRRRHPMDLVDEEHLVLLEVGEHGRKVSSFLDDRAGGRAHRHAKLVADDVRKRGLAKSGRAVQKDVIERFLPATRRFDRHLQVVAHAILPDVLGQGSRAQPRFILRVVVDGSGGDKAVVHGRLIASIPGAHP